MIYFHLSAVLQIILFRFKILSVKIITNQASLSPCARKAILLGAKLSSSPLSTDHLSDNGVAPITM